MKFAQSYSFKSPLALAEIHGRLRDLGPWQWGTPAGESLTANLPSPDRGTVKITVRPAIDVIEIAGESSAESLQSIYDTVFTHVLPAISATEVKIGTGIEPAPAMTDDTAYRNFAYTFDSPLKLAEVFAKLNAAGPWTWFERENDRLDDYLSAAPIRSPHRGIAKIFVDHGRFVVDVDMKSSERDAKSVFEKAERELLERVLPSIGATNIAETEPLD